MNMADTASMRGRLIEADAMTVSSHWSWPGRWSWPLALGRDCVQDHVEPRSSAASGSAAQHRLGRCWPSAGQAARPASRPGIAGYALAANASPRPATTLLLALGTVSGALIAGTLLG
jgi:hypothetical protein